MDEVGRVRVSVPNSDGKSAVEVGSVRTEKRQASGQPKVQPPSSTTLTASTSVPTPMPKEARPVPGSTNHRAFQI